MGGRSSRPAAPAGPSAAEVAQQTRVVEQQAQLDRQESDLAGRTSASLRASRRGRGRAMLLGGDEQQSTLG